MNILDNNYNIAVFMGSKYSKDRLLDINDNQIFVPLHGVCRYDTIESGKGKILEYHKSWDWLFPVINKIKSIIEEPEELDILKQVLWFGSIEDVYNEVVDFIKEYNNDTRRIINSPIQSNI